VKRGPSFFILDNLLSFNSSVFILTFFSDNIVETGKLFNTKIKPLNQLCSLNIPSPWHQPALPNGTIAAVLLGQAAALALVTTAVWCACLRPGRV